MTQGINKVWQLDGYDGAACEWGVEISCDPIHMLDERALRQIGEQLVKHQVVVIRDQKNLDPLVLRRLCLAIGDLEGSNLGDGSSVEDPRLKQLYLDFNAAPGVMRVTGKLNEAGRQSGFFGHVSELDWHCNKASLSSRHSHVTLYSVYGSEGSKTSWLDTTKAYVDLPEEKKEYYKTLSVVCGYRRGAYSNDISFLDHVNEDQTWPLVQEKYGKVGLFFPFNQVFNFVPVFSSARQHNLSQECDNFKEEFEYLKNHIIQDKYMYHHYWRDGDIILSDQNITLHKRWEFANMKDRLLLRLAHGLDNIR